MWIEIVPSVQVAKDNYLGKKPGCELSVAIVLQMSILSQEDITTATTAAQTLSTGDQQPKIQGLWE